MTTGVLAAPRNMQDIVVSRSPSPWSPERLLPYAMPRTPNLAIMREARALLTPFRRRTLRTMFDAALELGGASLLAEASVDAWLAPAEESDPELVLNLLVDGSWGDVREMESRVIARIAEQFQAWSEEERKDYAHMIYLSVGPLSP